MYCDKISNSKIKNRGNLLVWGFVLAVMAAIAVGDAELVATAAGANESFKSMDTDVTSGESAVSVGGNIQSIKFNRDEGIKGALRALGALYQKNIVPSAKVNGVLGFTTLRDVTFEEAMDAVLGTDLKYEQTGQLVKVYTKEEYKKLKEDEDRMIHRVFTLYYITAEEAEKLIKPVLSTPHGVVQASTAAEQDISGGGGSGSSGGSSLSGSGGGNSLALHDTIVVYDYPENIAKVEEVIVALDIRPKQVLVEATILSALLTEEMKLGIDWNTIDGVAVTKTVTDGMMTDGLAGAITGVAGLTVGITQDHVKVFIRALEEVTDITVLANPKILALNKQEGSVLIGRKLGYRESTSVTAAGTETKGSVKFLPTGTRLVFRPYIGNDGYIRMQIYPKDSTAEIDTDGVPQETTTELQTNILVKDGETIVIGGLFRDVVTTSRQQVPLLGDIPLIGALFRGTTDATQRQEVIVMLTPHIITEPEQTEGAARADDVARKRYGARKTLQWVGRARLAEDRYTEAVKDYIDGDNKAALFKVNWALELRPTYLEAIRLKERIIGETAPDDVTMIERIMLDVIEREEANKWLRR